MVIHGCESQLHLKTQEGPISLVAFGPEGLRPTCSAVFGSLQLFFFIILAGDCHKCLFSNPQNFAAVSAHFTAVSAVSNGPVLLAIVLGSSANSK